MKGNTKSNAEARTTACMSQRRREARCDGTRPGSARGIPRQRLGRLHASSLPRLRRSVSALRDGPPLRNAPRLARVCDTHLPRALTR